MRYEIIIDGTLMSMDYHLDDRGAEVRLRELTATIIDDLEDRPGVTLSRSSAGNGVAAGLTRAQAANWVSSAAGGDSAYVDVQPVA